MPRYHLWTIGCQMNKAESQRVAGLLSSAGYDQESRLDAADLVVLNTCVVRKSAEDRVIGTLGLLAGMKRKRPHLRIAVTGCFTAQDLKSLQRRFPQVDLFFGSGQYDTLSTWLEEAPEHAEPGCHPCLPPGTLEVVAQSTASSFVPIIQGCNNFCTYCIVPYTRGREISRPPEYIEEEIRRLVSGGTREIVLLGQNVDSYGHDLPGKPDLADLLARLQPIEGLSRLRFLTNHPKDMSNKLIQSMASLDKVCEHLDLALQSGDNDILRAMARGYTVDHFRRLVGDIRTAIPDIAISTDIIVGFPGETDDQFENTLSTLEEMRFDTVHVAAYSPRSGTVAASRYQDSVSGQTKLERLHRIEELQETIATEINARYLQREFEILVQGYKRGKWFGRTRTHKLVFFSGEDIQEGALIRVGISRTSPWALQGEVVYNSTI